MKKIILSNLKENIGILHKKYNIEILFTISSIGIVIFLMKVSLYMSNFEILILFTAVLVYFLLSGIKSIGKIREEILINKHLVEQLIGYK